MSKGSECYKTIRDSFTVPGLCGVESIMLFNNGLETVEIDGSVALKAGYGIRLRYTDSRGRRRCVFGYGKVMFFGEVNGCEGVTVHIEESDKPSVCDCYVTVTAKIKLEVAYNIT